MSHRPKILAGGLVAAGFIIVAGIISRRELETRPAYGGVSLNKIDTRGSHRISADIGSTQKAKPAVDFDREAVTATDLVAWTRRDPAAACHWATAHGRLRELIDILSEAGDYPLAVDCALTAETADARREFLARVIGGWTAFDPAGAGSALLALSPSVENDAITVAVMQTWLQHDGDSAAAFALQLPPGALRQRVFEQLASTWVPVEPMAAAEFTTEISAGPERDALLAALAAQSAWLPAHADWALAWAKLIGSDETRFNSLAVILRSLGGENGAVAWQYASANLALTAKQRADLMELLRR